MKLKSDRNCAILISIFLFSFILCPPILFSSEGQSSSPLIFSSFEGREWVEKCVEQYPEVLWLAQDSVRKTEEGQATLNTTYSEQLFGKKYIEFDRTLMTLHCLRLILDGSERAYQSFTASQLDNKLLRESFHELHLQGQNLLNSQWSGLTVFEMAQAMETALVLGDMGKSKKTREIFKPFGITAPDQDDFYGDALPILEKHPELSRSFARLPSAVKTLLVKNANQAHYGHVTHLEGGIGMFHKLKENRAAVQDPIALDFDLFVHTCDVAGALGHVNNNSSVAYTELTHRALQAMGDAVRVLSHPEKTENDAYKAYLQIRASWLGLDPALSSDRVLARIGAMLRLFTLEEGIVLRKAMNRIEPDMRRRISAQLDVQQKEPIRTPTYIPALLVNLSNNFQLGDTREERLHKAITIGLSFITRVLEKHDEMLANGEIDSNIPLNFNEMAGVAKKSPHHLINADFSIDKEGMIQLIPKHIENLDFGCARSEEHT